LYIVSDHSAYVNNTLREEIIAELKIANIGGRKNRELRN